jgi:hypothetical protein
MEVPDVRRRVRGAIEEARKRAAERRTESDAASRAWEDVLPNIVVPAFHAIASALTGEGYRFKVVTPGEAARLVRETSAEEFIEMSLDTARELPAVMVRSTRGRGRRMVSSERLAREGAAIAQLSEEDVVALLLSELVPFVER